jgi:MFS family permease
MKLHIPPALRHKKYFYLWLGLLVSIAGSQMQMAALHWHIRTLTGEPDPLALGGIGLARILPVLVFSFIGGPVADTFNRRRVLFITQSVMALVALALAILTLTGQITIWYIYLLTAVQASAQAFDAPSRQAMIPSLVPVKDLPNAFSLSSIAHNTGAILGPALAGIVIATLGQEYTYFFNAISFFAVISALILMGTVLQDTRNAPGIKLSAAIDGFRFIFSKKIILSTMVMDFVATFFASAKTMLPIVAKDILKVNEIGYGWLASAESVGSVIAGLVISQIHVLRRQGRIFLSAVTIFGLSTILFGLAYKIGPEIILFALPAFPITLAFLVAFLAMILSGAADAVSTIIRNTIRQLNTPDHLRGRMVSVNQIFFQGGPQLGEVESGIVASLFGVPFAIVSGGIGCILGVALIILRWPELRHYNGDEHLAAPAAV